MSSSAEISVIIPTLNEERCIGKLLYYLSKQTQLPAEIIVVDGNSTDNTQKRIREYRHVKLLTVKTPSPGRQRTVGGQAATGQILFFFDADVELDPTTLEKLYKSFVVKKLSVGIPLYIPSSKNPIIRSVYGLFNTLFFFLQYLQPSGAGSAIIVSRDIFRKVDGFREDHHYDDIIFLRKAASYGTFRQIRIPVRVSSRRFEQYGIFRTTLLYFLLSFLFLFGRYDIANRLQYEFGNYSNIKARNRQ